MKSDALWTADLGDGTYRNPVLFCDYSDPDAIRVGDTYYMTASSFNYTPGLPILTSRDLVNWELKNYALKAIPEARYDAPQHAQGVWAPAIRYHDGMFMIFYGMPDEGIFMVRARDALGEWEEPVCVLPGKGLIDPCPLWDDDGRAHVIHGYAKSRIGFKSVLGIFPISADGTRAIGPDRILYDGREKHPTMEGPKAHKKDGWYVILTPAGGVPTGWQVMLRSRSLMGPYEDRVILKQGSTPVNGPHQGAWVETPSGESWFLHFQSRGLYGRIVHLQPMVWGADGWATCGVKDEHPVDPASIPAGEDAKEAAVYANAADCGVPVSAHKKPDAPACEPLWMGMSDGFDADRPGLQWQFMGNWKADFFEMEKLGALRLYARAAGGRRQAVAMPAGDDAEDRRPVADGADGRRCGASAPGRAGGSRGDRRSGGVRRHSPDGGRLCAGLRADRGQSARRARAAVARAARRRRGAARVHRADGRRRGKGRVRGERGWGAVCPHRRTVRAGAAHVGRRAAGPVRDAAGRQGGRGRLRALWRV